MVVKWSGQVVRNRCLDTDTSRTVIVGCLVRDWGAVVVEASRLARHLALKLKGSGGGGSGGHNLGIDTAVGVRQNRHTTSKALQT